MVGLTADHPEPFSLYPKVSPVEFIGVLTLIYVHGVIPSAGKQLTSTELSAAITQMRQVLRREHHDIRLNDRVGKTIIDFIKSYKKPVLEVASVARKPSLSSPSNSRSRMDYHSKRTLSSDTAREHKRVKFDQRPSTLSSTPPPSTSSTLVNRSSPPKVSTGPSASTSLYTSLVGTSQKQQQHTRPLNRPPGTFVPSSYASQVPCLRPGPKSKVPEGSSSLQNVLRPRPGPKSKTGFYHSQ
ncbi:hypothetical protein FB446DRAFT_709457 [Lentinula raphanica]|nr:hypothetical protein FB446DRAFT_709457 [Lentinula raphanica]